jgi:DNA processing protein
VIGDESAAAERAAWLALAAVPGIGAVLFARLVGAFGSARASLEAAAAGQLGGTGRELGIPAPARRAIAEGLEAAATRAGALAELGLWTLTPLDAAWPGRLAVVAELPPVLYGWGDPNVLSAPRAIAIVGTRRPTLVGRALTSRIATAVALREAVVVSGLAIGIDGAAHAACLAAGGRTVAVIGAGHRSPGPTAHRDLVRRAIDGGGAVVSELHPDLPASRGTFPRRNRIISGLADATVIVEAPRRSGALITGSHALEQGRPLFVAPGRPEDPATAGCLDLLAESDARPVASIAHLIDDLGWERQDSVLRARLEPPEEERGWLPGSVEQELARIVAAGPATLDALVTRTGLPPGTVAGALTLLQLRGWVRPMHGTYLAAGPLLAGRVGRAAPSRPRSA